MPIQPGNTSRLNVVKGCSQLLEVDSSDTSLLDKVLPANILLRDSTTGGLYLTDGLHDLSYIFANNELLSDSEMTAEAVTTIATQILYANNE
jgi:hypothetical protein